MALTGNILDITTKRDNRHQAIALEVDEVEYITSRKDGHYFQDFDYVDVLTSPLVITGDCLARAADRSLDQGEYAFQVFDKTGEEYVLNPQKHLVVSLEYVEEDDLTILTSVYYTVTVTNEEFQQIKRDKNKEKMLRQRKDKKHR
jgi:hypothetical protein